MYLDKNMSTKTVAVAMAMFLGLAGPSAADENDQVDALSAQRLAAIQLAYDADLQPSPQR